MLYKFTSLGFVVCLLLFALAIALKKGPYGRSETIQFNHNKEPDIDMFLGNWQESAPRYAYGTLEVRDILTKSQGDPLHPTKKGAVLTDINSLSYAILEEHVSTTELF